MTDPLTRPAPDEVAGAREVTGLARVLRPFQGPAYRRLAGALVCTSFATGMWLVALVWEVIRIGGGPGELSVVATVNSIGVLVPALIAGVVADRVPQKLILLGVAAIELTGMTLAAVLSLTDRTELWHLAVIGFFLGFGLAFYYPAYSAWLPALVDEDDLMAVNGFEGMVRPAVSQAAGPGLAGLVVGAISPGAALSVAAVWSLVGLLILLLVPRTPVRRELQRDGHPVRTALTDMREGFVYMVRTPWLLSTLLFASLMILVMMGPMEVLVPFLIKDKLDGGPGSHAAVLAAYGIGGALGSLLMAMRPMPRRYLTFMNLMWGVGCLPLGLMVLSPEVWIVVALGLLCGMMFSAPMVIWGTLLQRRVPPALLGRVSSLDFFVSISLMPISMALAGPMAEWIGLETTFLLAGTLPVAFAILAIVLARLPEDELANPLR